MDTPLGCTIRLKMNTWLEWEKLQHITEFKKLTEDQKHCENLREKAQYLGYLLNHLCYLFHIFVYVIFEHLITWQEFCNIF